MRIRVIAIITRLLKSNRRYYSSLKQTRAQGNDRNQGPQPGCSPFLMTVSPRRPLTSAELWVVAGQPGVDSGCALDSVGHTVSQLCHGEWRARLCAGKSRSRAVATSGPWCRGLEDDIGYMLMRQFHHHEQAWPQETTQLHKRHPWTSEGKW